MEHWLHIEETIEKFYYHNLADEYDSNNEEKLIAYLELEEALACLEWTGIAHIPEVSPYKNGEQ